MLTNWDELPEKEVAPGLFGKFFHTDNMTLVRWRFLKNADLPEHNHPHEQITYVLEGKFVLHVGEKVHQLGPGDIVPIPSNIPHSGTAMSDCIVLDVFYPVREDFK